MITYKGVLVFMAIWVAGCAMADGVFLFETRSLSMSWGYVVGLIAGGAATSISKPNTP